MVIKLRLSHTFQKVAHFNCKVAHLCKFTGSTIIIIFRAYISPYDLVFVYFDDTKGMAVYTVFYYPLTLFLLLSSLYFIDRYSFLSRDNPYIKRLFLSEFYKNDFILL